jgi:hypothetical protein
MTQNPTTVSTGAAPLTSIVAMGSGNTINAIKRLKSENNKSTRFDKPSVSAKLIQAPTDNGTFTMMMKTGNEIADDDVKAPTMVQTEKEATNALHQALVSAHAVLNNEAALNSSTVSASDKQLDLASENTQKSLDAVDKVVTAVMAASTGEGFEKTSEMFDVER